MVFAYLYRRRCCALSHSSKTPLDKKFGYQMLVGLRIKTKLNRRGPNRVFMGTKDYGLLSVGKLETQFLWQSEEMETEDFP